MIKLQPGSTEGATYAVAMSKVSSNNYCQRLYKVNLATGKQVASVEVTACFRGTRDDSIDGVAYFDPAVCIRGDTE